MESSTTLVTTSDMKETLRMAAIMVMENCTLTMETSNMLETS